MAKWKDQRRQRLASEINNHETEWGDFEHPGIGNAGADGLIRQARAEIKKMGAEAREKRTGFPDRSEWLAGWRK